MKKLVKFGRFTTFISVVVLFMTSCNNNDDPTPPNLEGAEGKYLIGTTIMNPQTYSGRSYFQLLEKITGQKIDNKKAISAPLSYPKIQGNDIYLFPAYKGETVSELQKYTRKNGNMTKTGALPVPENSSATNIVFASKTKAYLAMAGMGKIWIFNPQTMKKTGEIDITKLGIEDNNPDPGAMILRDGFLYVGLNQMVGGFIPKPERPYADVAIIDTKTDSLLKMITEKISGMSMPTRPIISNSIFKDEKNDIYIACTGAFGKIPTHKTGFLRIKSGKTEFDKDYKWDLTQTNIEGEANKTSFIETVVYKGEGKAYGYTHIPAYEKEGETAYTAFAMEAVEFDLYKKTIKKLNLPMANSLSVGVYKYKDLIVFASFNQKASGFYSYNPKNEEVKGPILETTGYPVLFHYFE